MPQILPKFTAPPPPPPAPPSTLSVSCLLCNSYYLTLQAPHSVSPDSSSGQSHSQGLDLLSHLLGISQHNLGELGLDPNTLTQSFLGRSQPYCPSCMTRLRNILDWRELIHKMETNIKLMQTEIQGILVGSLGDSAFLDTYWIKSKIIQLLTQSENQQSIRVYDVPIEDIVMEIHDSHPIEMEHSSPTEPEPSTSYKPTTTKSTSSRKSKKNLNDPSSENVPLTKKKDTRNRKGRKRNNVRGEYKCSHCPHICTLKNSLFTHMKRKHSGKLFQCKFCDAKFDDGNYVLKHEKIVHLAQLDFKCNQCEKTFKSQIKADTHAARVHLGVKPRLSLTGPRKCEHCDRILSSEINLKRHISKYHRNRKGKLARKYCPVCEKPCLSKQHVERHMRTHYSKEELEQQHLLHPGDTEHKSIYIQFICEECPDKPAYSNKRGLERHISNGHRTIKSLAKPITCKKCGVVNYGFKASRRHNVENHPRKLKRKMVDKDDPESDELSGYDSDVIVKEEIEDDDDINQRDEESSPVPEPEIRKSVRLRVIKQKNFIKCIKRPARPSTSKSPPLDNKSSRYLESMKNPRVVVVRCNTKS